MGIALEPADPTFLEALRARSRDLGIRTADTYLREFEACLDGSCPSHVLEGMTEKKWRGLMKRASQTVVYQGGGFYLGEMGLVKEGSIPQGLVLPPKTIGWVNTIVTTPTRDRDGDVLETLGAHIFPRASHLFNHLPTENVGRFLKETAHTKDLLSALLTLHATQLAEDVATMYEHGSLETSHGFLPRKWEPLKDGEGFHIMEFDILEISGVSVPSNPDAGPIEFSRNKLTHPLLKQWGQWKFRNRKAIAAVGIDLASLPPGTTITLGGDKPAGEKSSCGCHLKSESQEFRPIGPPKEMDFKGAPRVLHKGSDSSEPNPVRWNRTLSKTFDVASESLQPASLIYDWASKYLDVPVKKIFFTNAFIPAARMGSFLSAWDVTTSDYQTDDVRHVYYDGTEAPPVYEVVQLNSKQSSDFLVAGTCFMRGDDGKRMLASFEPTWGGLTLKLYFAMKDREEAMELVPKTWEVAKTQFNFLKGESFSLSGEFLPETSETWDDLFLEPKNQKSLSRTIKQLNDKQAKFANRGIVLLGPPGTGKTLSGRIMRNEANATFIWLSSRDFYYSGAFGSLTYAFDLAKELAPSIIFIEDIDNWMRETTIDLLKTEMDGIGRSAGILTILTTNYPERFPDALLDRPGRFHDVLKLDLPDKSARSQMLAKWVGDLPAETCTKILDATEGWSGAHMYELAQFAKVLQEQDELELSDSLTKAIDKITEQRDLISDALLGGSRFKPRKELIEALKTKGFQMITKAMTKDAREYLGKAMEHCQKAMDHDDATAGTSFHAKRAHTHVKAVHDAHGEPDETETEEKAEVTSEHVDRLKKAMGYCSKGMNHKEATEEIKGCFKSASDCIGKALKEMGEKDAADGDPEEREEEGEKSVKTGRAISAANEKKLNRAKAHMKSIADDDEAHAEVRKSASDGAESIDGIFSAGKGGDAGQDYDENGVYQGTDVGAYTDGEPNKNVVIIGKCGHVLQGPESRSADLVHVAGVCPDCFKSGKVLSAKNRALVQKAIGHAQAVIDHAEADEGHKALATAAKTKLKSVMGEGSGDDGPAMGTDPSTAEPGQGKSVLTLVNELADEMELTAAEADEEKRFELVECAGAVQRMANTIRDAQLDLDLSLAENIDRILDLAEAS